MKLVFQNFFRRLKKFAVRMDNLNNPMFSSGQMPVRVYQNDIWIYFNTIGQMLTEEGKSLSYKNVDDIVFRKYYLSLGEGTGYLCNRTFRIDTKDESKVKPVKLLSFYDVLPKEEKDKLQDICTKLVDVVDSEHDYSVRFLDRYV